MLWYTVKQLGSNTNEIHASLVHCMRSTVLMCHTERFGKLQRNSKFPHEWMNFYNLLISSA